MESSEAMLDRIKNVFLQVFDQLPDPFDRSIEPADVEGWDSVNHINLVFALENEFSVKFLSQEVQEMTSVGAIADVIAHKCEL